MKPLLYFLSLSMMLTLLSPPVYAQTVPLSEKGYIGKWTCQSKSFIVYGLSPREERPCSTPPETLEIKANNPDQLTISFDFNRSTKQVSLASLFAPTNITQEDIEYIRTGENTGYEAICFAGIMMPRCIHLSNNNTLIYRDEMGGNSTLTIIFKRQKTYPQ